MSIIMCMVFIGDCAIEINRLPVSGGAPGLAIENPVHGLILVHNNFTT